MHRKILQASRLVADLFGWLELATRNSTSTAKLKPTDKAANTPVIPQWVDLENVWTRLGDDERRVLFAIARRLDRGSAQYGRLDIARDHRDWTKEENEEHMDAVVYATIATLKR